jgi:BirA family biotin operon repressor/biotin-[acetyl-CoA-carboxylase] ligase
MTTSTIDEAALDAALTTARFGRSRTLLAETGSTNDDAREAALAGAADGHVVLADRQTAGRGSRGRVWDSREAGDLYFSVVLRVGGRPADLAPLTLAVGLGVSRAVDGLVGARSEVKWPNDVRLDGRKCAGILLEASSRSDALEAVVCGIGLDVNRAAFAPELAPVATSLARFTGHAFDRAEVLARVLGEVETAVDGFLRDGVPAAELDARLALRGRAVRVDGTTGIVDGVDPSGALRLRVDGRPKLVLAGTVVPL